MVSMLIKGGEALCMVLPSVVGHHSFDALWSQWCEEEVSGKRFSWAKTSLAYIGDCKARFCWASHGGDGASNLEY